MCLTGVHLSWIIILLVKTNKLFAIIYHTSYFFAGFFVNGIIRHISKTVVNKYIVLGVVVHQI